MQILSRFFGVGIVMSERFCALLPPDLSQTCRRLDVVSTSQRIRLGASPRPRRPLARSFNSDSNLFLLLRLGLRLQACATKLSRCMWIG